MSLDVYLIRRKPAEYVVAAGFLEEHGFRKAATYLRAAKDEKAYEASIVGSVAGIAEAAGIYQALWRPEDIGVKTAHELAPLLAEGLTRLRADPDRYRVLSASIWLGTCEQFVSWVEAYWYACLEFPEAEVEVSR